MYHFDRIKWSIFLKWYDLNFISFCFYVLVILIPLMMMAYFTVLSFIGFDCESKHLEKKFSNCFVHAIHFPCKHVMNAHRKISLYWIIGNKMHLNMSIYLNRLKSTDVSWTHLYFRTCIRCGLFIAQCFN